MVCGQGEAMQGKSEVLGRLDLSAAFHHGICADGIDRLLGALRRHLRMDVAFIAHFGAGERVMEHVDSVPDGPIHRGQRISLQEGYCLKVVRGELPQCIPDTSCNPAAMAIGATHAIPIGSHLSVPVTLEDGTLYGTLCCFSFLPDPTLGSRDMQLMHAFAEVLAMRFDEQRQALLVRESRLEEIRAAIAHGAPRIVFQPIWGIARHDVLGVEALSRFDVAPYRSPEQWFEMARLVGAGLELESLAIAHALAALPRLPRGYISINASPALILSGGLLPLLELPDPSRIVLEITEHVAVGDYATLAQELRRVRRQGVRLAVDDAGAGFSSMRHILNLEPEIIKLDMSITQQIDADSRRRAMAKGLTNFAHEIGSAVIAEGVERPQELEVLAQLGVDCAQGYLLARPLDLDAAAACAAAH